MNYSSLVKEAAYTTALDELFAETLHLWGGLIQPAVDDICYLLCMKKGDGACDHRLCGFVGEHSCRDIGERVHDWTGGLPGDSAKAVANPCCQQCRTWKSYDFTSPARANSIVRSKKGSECFEISIGCLLCTWAPHAQ